MACPGFAQVVGGVDTTFIHIYEVQGGVLIHAYIGR